jgi:hypothetical protein
MQLSNFTNDTHLDLLYQNEPELIGWVIYRQDTEEFFHSHNSSSGFRGDAYTKEPALAQCFNSESQAFRYSVFSNKPTKVLPLFDFGDKLGVVFDD